ncbi:MAG: Twitching mobility protein [Candidatus Omnitrophica bacterium ADurb.Bin314]|jgi:pilus retraction protein PilT|nr:MAG: Twitching mobility protein [Candidatus Omnitrophica bacterium ADurb.Bin314]
MSVLEYAIDLKGQDVFFKADTAPRMRLGHLVTPLPFPPVTGERIEAMSREILTPKQLEGLTKNKSIDFGLTHSGKGCRFRGNIFYQQGTLSAVFRLLWKGVPDFSQLALPPILQKVALEKAGIILIGGTVSSGKTTTIAAMIHTMNENAQKHVITIEDPIEYLHEDKQCLIQQREVGEDTESFASAMKYIVRQSPDVVVIGEMRDAESFSFALASAEVGRLVISTVHAQSVGQVFDRVLGFFAPEHREAVLRHFAMNVSCIAVQKLLVGADGKSLVPAVEIMLGSYIIKQLIMEHRVDKLAQALRNSSQEGMQTMDQSLLQLWEKKLITRETALASSQSPQELEAWMKGIKIGQDTKILGG